ncbi:hypothetical protein, partial [Pseudoalteromonas sp.]|uniref:hypothetical protein n=1 Tax=Pseudoalteromonas sp. TaxID=53249 RepID=UPI002634B41B
LDFSGAVRDETKLQSIQLQTTGPGTGNTWYTFDEDDLNGTYSSLASFDFDTSDTDYAGIAGAYSVRAKVFTLCF